MPITLTKASMAYATIVVVAARQRITIARVVGGALAKLALRKLGITLQAYTSQVGDIALPFDYTHYDLTQVEKNAVRCPDSEVARRMEELILSVKKRATRWVVW